MAGRRSWRAAHDTPDSCQLTVNAAGELRMIERHEGSGESSSKGGGPMMQFEAIEVMGRERREALVAEAENHRLTRPARMRARRERASKVSSLRLSIRRPSLRWRRRPVDWDLPVTRPAQRAT
jgi:hypothetical protein